MSRRPRVVVVGSLNVDLTAYADRLPEAGETLLARRFELGHGGKGANQAAAARLCGAEVAMVGRVGDDLFGPAMVANLERLGIDASRVKAVPGASSGAAPILVDGEGRNRILVAEGANAALTPADVEAAEDAIRAADAVLLQLESPVDAVLAAVRLARRHGARCLLNPAPARPLDLAALAGLDWIIPNESEAAALCGRPARDAAGARACAESLRAAGIKGAVVTLGEKGALLAGPAGTEHLPAFPVRAVDTAGAGDAFIGSFAVLLCEGLPAREAARRACLYAALSTTKPGTQRSFPDRAALEAALT